jgi:xylan 1,4-beta-xylosidase
MKGQECSANLNKGDLLMPFNHFFNAHHSPIGAFSSFTLGFPKNGGGLDLELGRSPKQNVYIGLESKNHTGTYEALPFFEYVEDELG